MGSSPVVFPLLNYEEIHSETKMFTVFHFIFLKQDEFLLFGFSLNLQ